VHLGETLIFVFFWLIFDRLFRHADVLRSASWPGIPTHMVNDVAASLWAMLELNQDAVFRWAAQAPW
jgi:hypothetical protein